MKTNISIISKESTTAQIRKYFTKVLDLSKKENEYPVNLNEVWALVYNQKSDAVKVLKKDFIENIDYQVLRRIPQNPKGGRPSEEYILSVPCLEFFIARKIRPVFDVYRKVFHAKISDNSFEKELHKYLSKRLSELPMNIRKGNELMASRYGYKYPLMSMDISYGCHFNPKMSVLDAIDNLIAIFNNNTIAGLRLLYREDKYRQDNTEIKKLTDDFFEKISERHHILLG